LLFFSPLRGVKLRMFAAWSRANGQNSFVTTSGQLHMAWVSIAWVYDVSDPMAHSTTPFWKWIFHDWSEYGLGVSPVLCKLVHKLSLQEVCLWQT
jgi:hypothetical protein